MLSDRLLRLLTAYVDGEATAHQRRVVLRRLRKSPEARSVLKKLQDDANELRQLPACRLGQDLSQGILERIGSQVVRPIRISAPQVPSAVPRGFGLATAAAVLLALGFGSVYYLKAVRERPPEIAAVVPETPTGLQAEKNSKPGDATVKVAPEPKPGEATSKTVVQKEEKPEPLRMPSLVKDTETVLTAPVAPPGHFEVANIKVAMKVASRDLLWESPRLQLLERLHKEPAQHIDLYCKQTWTALARMETAFKEQGVYFVLAPDAARPYLFGSRDTDYVLFTENVKPEEVLDVLKQVADQDRRLEARKGKPQFQDLLVNGVSARDHDLLKNILGVDPTQLPAAKPTAPLGLDVRKPIAMGAADAIVRNLEGKGGVPRPQPGKPAVKAPERLVVVGTCNPIHPNPKSKEIQRFLDNRKQRNDDTMQMLMILRQGK
jgi:anti-sigma factor RsiW